MYFMSYLLWQIEVDDDMEVFDLMIRLFDGGFVFSSIENGINRYYISFYLRRALWGLKGCVRQSCTFENRNVNIS